MLSVNSKLNHPIYHGAKAKTLSKAHDLRLDMTPMERVLWHELRKRRVLGFQFRRQHVISQFIVDFYCHEAKLVIEVDGEYHNSPDQKDYDEGRTAELEDLGLKVIRFTNQEVEFKLNYVLNEIKNYLQHFAPPKSSPAGRT